MKKVYLKFRLFFIVLFICQLANIGFSQTCNLAFYEGGDGVTESEVMDCLSLCSCSSITVTSPITMVGDWNLGDVTITILTGMGNSGSIALGSNGNLNLGTGGVIIVNPANSGAITGSGNAQVNFGAGIQVFGASLLDDIGAAGGANINGLLPIELVSFQGQIQNTSIHLHWRTATEQNNDYMAVERSADGAKFTELGRVKGAGTTEEPQAYRFVDEHPLRGLNYYRLRQVDFDGAFEYPKTISVLFDGKRQGLGIQAWPNPVQGQLQATWAAASDQATTLQVLDMTGRKLAEYQAAAGVSTFDLPLNGLPAGLYFLKARQGQEEEVVRFHKQ